MSVSNLKQEVARSEYDARFAAADRNRVASIENCVAHLFTHLDRGSKAWVTVKISFPRRFAWFLPFDFSLAVAIDSATGHARSGAKKYRTRSRKKVSGRRFKTRSVGLVEAETFFLFGLMKKLSRKSFIEAACTAAKGREESFKRWGKRRIHGIFLLSSRLQHRVLVHFFQVLLTWLNPLKLNTFFCSLQWVEKVTAQMIPSSSPLVKFWHGSLFVTSTVCMYDRAS